MYMDMEIDKSLTSSNTSRRKPHSAQRHGRRYDGDGRRGDDRGGRLGVVDDPVFGAGGGARGGVRGGNGPVLGARGDLR